MVDIVLSPEEVKELRNLLILVNARNALSEMGSKCTVDAATMIMSSSDRLINDIDKEIARQRETFFIKTTHNHLADLIQLFVEALPKEASS